MIRPVSRTAVLLSLPALLAAEKPGVGAAGSTNAPAGPAPGIIRNWGISLRDGASGRVQVRFSSTEAAPAKAGDGLMPASWDVTGLKLETFRPDESADFTIEAPACRVNVTTRDAASPGPFVAHRESDGIRMTGTGFSFDNGRQRLVVSNDVRIELRATLVRTASPSK